MANVESADVSVVIVSYNTRAQLRRCIDSVDRACEVIVVDNASSDGSIEMLRADERVRLIENGENLGFGTANNQGIAVAKRPLILLLNSDAWAMPGSIATLASVFGDEQVIAAGASFSTQADRFNSRVRTNLRCGRCTVSSPGLRSCFGDQRSLIPIG